MPEGASEQVVPSSANFGGATVVAFESRMAAETAALIERFGGTPIVAPAMREVPLEENPAAFAFAAQLLAGSFDIVVFLTGIGVRELFRVLETRYPRDQLVNAFASVLTVGRGPKPIVALRALGIETSIAIGEPNTWREIVAALDRRGPLDGKRVAVQEYGVANHDLIAALEARNALVIPLPVYRWTLPLDRAPLRAAIETIAAGHADAVLFTSSNQATNLMRVAEAEGLDEKLRRGLNNAFVGSIGPVCSEQLRALGIPINLEPSHPKLGHLIKEMSAAYERSHPHHAAVVAAPVTASSTERLDSLTDHPFMRACRCEPAPYTPIWLMRQAGRYMPEYRRVRAQYSFLEMCRTPELAAEVTVTAVERLKVDAAIIFADILLPLIPMGVGLRYEAGDGPIIEHPVRAISDLDRLPPIDAAESLGFVGKAIQLAKRTLGAKTPLIGFAGAPFTLASYLIEGGSSRQYQLTKTLAYKEPEIWTRLMTMLARVTIDYLKLQIAAGADVIQLFDSWVGSLGPDDYRLLVLPYMQTIIRQIRPFAPVIHFGTITGNLLELMREAGGDVIGLDWRINLDEAWKRVGYNVAVQGNLDPVALFTDPNEIHRRARAILHQAHGRPGHIFNLGHGILPDTPVDNVLALIDAVHELSAR
jgi:uroporphyrinogen decarboxylase